MVRPVVTTARLASSEVAGIGPEDEEKNKALVSKSYFEQSEQERNKGEDIFVHVTKKKMLLSHCFSSTCEQ